MKKFIVLFIPVLVLGLIFTSCSNEKVENITDSNAKSGTLKVDFDGKTFVSTSVQALVNDSYISITGLRAPNGDFVQITLPSSKVGTYTWKSVEAAGGVMALAYIPSNGVEGFVSEPKGSGGASDFPKYTDTASITISSIDTANKKISGTFQFTGAKFTDQTGTSIETKVMTNGSFTNISYTADTPAPLGNSFSAKLDGVAFIPTNTTALNLMDKINISARRGSVETIGLSFPNTIISGTYNLESIGTYIGVYNKNANSDGSGIFGADTGTITITSHDKVNKKVSGTFKFSANSFFSTEKHTITEGTFSVSY
ncbi:DUF6252 family protein [Flavobacterium sp. ZB4P13]|uniref:DUF6252 family protein n=1 Tax=Flavobacterium sp. ZB4P13 TaxID=3401728 RepID=UPI003AAF5EE8